MKLVTPFMLILSSYADITWEMDFVPVPDGNRFLINTCTRGQMCVGFEYIGVQTNASIHYDQTSYTQILRNLAVARCVIKIIR